MNAFCMERLLSILLGVLLDALIGDPHGLPHPVQAIGWLIRVTEEALRKLFHLPPPSKDAYEKEENASKRAKTRAAGILEVLIVAGISTAVPVFLLYFAGRIWLPFRWILSGIFFGQMYACRSLFAESMKVHDALLLGDVEGARHFVSMIVGRDTERLDAEGIARAAVETVAENASDGVIAPLLFMLVLGAPGVVFYKAVNTMDSMIGYTNERYRDFGTAAARLDDILNFLPSRISAIAFICAAFFTKDDAAGALKIWRRDRLHHPSPNSAQTESACAGALHIRLGGDAWYFGELHSKPTIGDPDRPVELEDIRRANRLMIAASLIVLVLGAAVLLISGLCAA